MTEDDFQSKVEELTRQIKILLRGENTFACMLALMSNLFASIHMTLDGETQEIVDGFMQDTRKQFDELEKVMRGRINIA